MARHVPQTRGRTSIQGSIIACCSLEITTEGTSAVDECLNRLLQKQVFLSGGQRKSNCVGCAKVSSFWRLQEMSKHGDRNCCDPIFDLIMILEGILGIPLTSTERMYVKYLDNIDITRLIVTRSLSRNFINIRDSSGRMVSHRSSNTSAIIRAR